MQCAGVLKVSPPRMEAVTMVDDEELKPAILKRFQSKVVALVVNVKQELFKDKHRWQLVSIDDTFRGNSCHDPLAHKRTDQAEPQLWTVER